MKKIVIAVEGPSPSQLVRVCVFVYFPHPSTEVPGTPTRMGAKKDPEPKKVKKTLIAGGCVCAVAVEGKQVVIKGPKKEVNNTKNRITSQIFFLK